MTVRCPQTGCRGTAAGAVAVVVVVVVAVSSVHEGTWNFINVCVQSCVLLHRTVILLKSCVLFVQCFT